MGGMFSSNVEEVALTCQYNKRDFNTRLDIIRDAHGIVQYYAGLLLDEKLPMQLPEYRNFNADSEEYFNSKRREQNPGLTAVNPRLNSYYDFYNALGNLQREYEKTDITGSERRTKITEVFKSSYTVMQSLIEDLWESCDAQGRPAPQ
jgi:hypothetical protein